MAQPATEENSQAQVLKFDDFSPKSDQAQSNQAQQSDQSEDRTCGVTENFTRMVTAAITLGSGSREKSRQALHADYVVAQAIGAAFDLQEHGLAEDIESTKNQKGEYFLVPIDGRCEAARLYRAKLEQLGRDMGLYDVLERTLPSLQAIFMEALAALESKQIER
jgi:hypothetical protein